MPFRSIAKVWPVRQSRKLPLLPVGRGQGWG